jgi:hypothetical protein
MMLETRMKPDKVQLATEGTEDTERRIQRRKSLSTDDADAAGQEQLATEGTENTERRIRRRKSLSTDDADGHRYYEEGSRLPSPCAL